MDRVVESIGDEHDGPCRMAGFAIAEPCYCLEEEHDAGGRQENAVNTSVHARIRKLFPLAGKPENRDYGNADPVDLKPKSSFHARLPTIF